jgi:hypothetical protein
MPCICAQCGGKTDCDSIICIRCLAEIFDRVNIENSKGEVLNEVQARGMEQSLRR